MQIVIDIKDETYKHCEEFNSLTVKQVVEVEKAIKNGIPLPKGHGRLIDADALYDSTILCHTEENGTACVEWREINEAPTIIESDKEGEDGD